MVNAAGMAQPLDLLDSHKMMAAEMKLGMLGAVVVAALKELVMVGALVLVALKELVMVGQLWWCC